MMWNGVFRVHGTFPYMVAEAVLNVKTAIKCEKKIIKT
jgi:hypothetical protein